MLLSDDSHIKNPDIFVSGSSFLLLSAHPSSLKSTNNTLTGEFLAEQDSIGGPVGTQNINKKQYVADRMTSQFYHQALVTVTPAFLSPTSAKPRIATPLLV